MRLLLDENAPVQWLSTLHDQGHDVDHVIKRGWQAASDEFVFARALEENYVLLTRNGFKRNPSRSAALKAMSDGLRIIRVTARTAERMTQAIEQTLDSVDQALAADPLLRRVTILNDLDLRFETLDEVVESLQEVDD